MVMQGYGGLLPASEAAERAIGMIECGPAAGVIGSRLLGDLMGDQPDVIAADMGGTTFKVSVIQDGEIEYAREPMVDRFHYVAAEDRSGFDRLGGRHRSCGSIPAARRRASVRAPPAHARVRSATGLAAPSRPSPTCSC